MSISVAIVEDDAGICEDLVKLFKEAADMVCVCACRNGRGALHKIPACAPDVVIMDIQLPDMSGIECTVKLKRLLPNTQVLMFTVRDDDEQVFRALEAGASGYLLKGSDPTELLDAVREITQGGSPMTSEISRKVVRSFHKPAAVAGQTDPLTPREQDVLKLLVEGCVSKEIADRLTISLQTVNFHLKQIYQKLHVRSRTEAVVKYLKNSRSA
jgi:DNA-binding NarL/FixJ family response regulator